LEHVNPDSVAQVALQPSPGSVFPSSQVSGPSLIPFPQLFQVLGSPVHVNPASV